MKILIKNFLKQLKKTFKIENKIKYKKMLEFLNKKKTEKKKII